MTDDCGECNSCNGGKEEWLEGKTVTCGCCLNAVKIKALMDRIEAIETYLGL